MIICLAVKALPDYMTIVEKWNAYDSLVEPRSI